MNEDKIFELAELLADEAFGKKGMIAYSERQELTSKFNEMLVKNLTLYGVSQAFCKCDKPQPNYPEMIWCDNCSLEIKQNANVTNKPIKTLNHKEDCACGDCTLLAKVFGNGG